MDNVCEGCRYWDRRNADSEVGRCMRHPPVIVPEFANPFGDEGMSLFDLQWNATTWPITDGEDFCGEWMDELEGVV